MVSVIIAGGSGSRLWPISTPDYPKHLLKIAHEKSLLRNTYERARSISDDVFVITDISHAHHVLEQIPELKKNRLLVEPGRRGTANCIVLALARISKIIDPNDAIAFLSADHHVRDSRGFAHSFKIAAETSEKNKKIILVGVEPDYPATGFGYIQKDGIFDEGNFVFNVDSFKEKPDLKTAQEYVKSGNYLWNCGYFVGTLDAFEVAMKNFSPGLYNRYDEFRKISNQNFDKYYLSLVPDTIDYALIEKVDNLLVVPANFDWLDLGSYTDIHKVVDTDDDDVYIKGKNVGVEAVENAYIHNDENKPVVVIGLDNVVVVNTADGLLVARKDQSQKVKEVLSNLKRSSNK